MLLTILHTYIKTLTPEECYTGYEEDGVDRGADGLIEGEFDGCVADGELLLGFRRLLRVVGYLAVGLGLLFGDVAWEFGF